MGLTRAGAAYALAALRVRLQSKRHISAMVRVRNEEEFLFASVASIADLVSEVVLIDNRSDDRTPAVIVELERAYPGKVSAWAYPHEIRRVGREHWELSKQRGDQPSPHLSTTFYNWSLARCRMPFVLKWDGDMIATPAFREAVQAWRASGRPILVFNGQNVHPDRRHLIRARVTDRDVLLARLSVPGLPKWVTSLTEDAMEPRLFPRFGARYDDGTRWTQRFNSPFEHGDYRARSRFVAREPCFLHMKFCKREPLSNYTDDLRQVIEGNIDVGEPLPPTALALLASHGVAAPPGARPAATP